MLPKLNEKSFTIHSKHVLIASEHYRKQGTVLPELNEKMFYRLHLKHVLIVSKHYTKQGTVLPKLSEKMKQNKRRKPL